MTKKYLDPWSESFLNKYENFSFKNTFKGISNNEKNPIQLVVPYNLNM